MNISKFILIDAVLVIAATPLLFLIQEKNKNQPLLRSSNKEDISQKSPFKLPNKNKLIELEKLAKIQGSGIELNSLVGKWKFVSIWKKDTDEEDSIFSSLLRFFSAKLEFKKGISEGNPLDLSIITSIQFGLLSIVFTGSGYLRGEQPLLPFFFSLIELKSGSSTLLSKSLDEPIANQELFFALIALDKSCGWLSARGQGGALVLWLKD